MAERIEDRVDEAPTAQQRDFLLRRLADLAVMPAGLVTAQERGLAISVMASAVSRLEIGARRRLAERIADLPEGPYELAVALAQDDVSVADPVLRNSIVLEESDLINVIHMGDGERCAAIAERKTVPVLVVDALIKYASSDIICGLIENRGAVISARSMEILVHRSASAPEFLPLLMNRPELTIKLAQIMFWWAPSVMRRDILHRFSVERRALHAALREALEPGIAATGVDEALRIMLSTIRPPQPAAKVQLAQLMVLSAHKNEQGFLELLAEQGRIRPETALRIMQDAGGEPLSVLGKAMGLTRREFGEFLVAAIVFRSAGLPDAKDVERIIAIFDSISIDRADLVLHCWDWAVATEAQLPPAGD